jgi:hypothetical protein
MLKRKLGNLILFINCCKYTFVGEHLCTVANKAMILPINPLSVLVKMYAIQGLNGRDEPTDGT